MSKYDPSKIISVQSRDVNHLHPKVKMLALNFIDKANQKLNPLGFQVKIISTLRSWKEQDELYKQGRTKPGKKVTNAVGGKSIHNWGCAFDIGIFQDGKYNTNDSLNKYALLGPIGEKNGLDWGGRWTDPVDKPHYQYTGKYSNSQFLKLVTVNNLDELLDYNYKEFETMEELLKSLGLI